MSELYSKYASEYADVIKNNIYNSLYDRPSLLSLVQSEKFASCLDMGCGPGAYIDNLKTFCKKITAIDSSQEFINLVASKYPEVNAYVWDLRNGLKREPDNSYSLVISPLTIHYIEDLKKLFAEVSRVLIEGGVFAFSTDHPNLDFPESLSGNYFEVEKLTQTWNTIPGKGVEVSFYRRPLSSIFNALFESGFVIDGFSEGKPSPKMKDVSPQHFEKLTSKPHSIFVRALKLPKKGS